MYSWSWSCYRTSSTSAWFAFFFEPGCDDMQQHVCLNKLLLYLLQKPFESQESFKVDKSPGPFWSNLQGKNSKLLRKDFKDSGIQWSQWLSVTHNPSGIPSHFFCGRKWWGFSKAETVDIPQGKARRLASSRHDDVVNPIVNHAQSYHTWVAKTIKHIFKTIPGLGGYCWVYHIIQVDFTWKISDMHYVFLREMSLRYLPGNSINPPDKVWISLAETQKVRSPLDKSRQEVH